MTENPEIRKASRYFDNRYAQAFHRATGGRQDNSFGAVRYDGRGHTILSWTRYTLCQGIHECSLLFCQHSELNKWLINFKLMD